MAFAGTLARASIVSVRAVTQFPRKQKLWAGEECWRGYLHTQVDDGKSAVQTRFLSGVCRFRML